MWRAACVNAVEEAVSCCNRGAFDDEQPDHLSRRCRWPNRFPTLQSLGFLEHSLGHPDEARDLYGKALDLFKKQQDSLGQANTLQSLGFLEHCLGHPDKARGLYDKALRLFENEQAGLGQANTLQSLGDLQRQAGKHLEALETYEKALSLYASEQEPVGSAYTLTELARCRHALNQIDARDVAFEQAFQAALACGVLSVPAYAKNALEEITGGSKPAQAWLGGRGMRV